MQAKYGYSFQSAAEGTGLGRGGGGGRGVSGLSTSAARPVPSSPTMRTAVVECRRPKSVEEDDDKDNKSEAEPEEEEGRTLLPRPRLLLPLSRASQGTSDEADRRTPTIEEEEPELEKLLWECESVREWEVIKKTVIYLSQKFICVYRKHSNTYKRYKTDCYNF